MKKIKHSPIILFLVVILLVLLPALVYLAINRQTLDRDAAPFGQITVNMTPIDAETTVGDYITVEVFVNSETIPLSALQVALSYDREVLSLIEILPELGAGKPFTDMLYEPDTSPDTFVLLALKPTDQLVSGTHKVAILRFNALDTAQGASIDIDTANSYGAGYNSTSEDVELTVASGTATTFDTTGQLCSVAMCAAPQTIQLTEEPHQPPIQNQNVTEGRRSISVSWDKPTTADSPTVYYKVYRNVNSSIPNHAETNPIIITQSTSFTDSNTGGGGFLPGSTVNYDIDTYMACGDLTPTPTPESSTPTNTPTPVTAITPTNTPSSAQNIMTLSDTSLTADSEGNCNATLSWDFSDYEDAGPSIYFEYIHQNGTVNPSQILCQGLSGCGAMGNPISLSVGPGTTTYEFTINGSQIIETEQLTCVLAQ